MNGFLIINYNDAESVLKLLDNIKEYRCLDLVVIVDNASTDDSYEKLKKMENQKIVVLKNPENRGYAAGINYGAKYLIELYDIENIIISNADIIIKKENDLKKLIKIANKKKDVGIVAPVVIEHGKENKGWKNPTPLQDTILNLPLIHKWIKPKMLFYKKEDYRGKLTYVDVVSGCFFLIKSDVLKKVYYLDETTFLYYEENILSSKLKNIGKTEVVVNDVQIFHNHSVTIDKSMKAYHKYKALKKSQYYFQTIYNRANFIERFCLKATAIATGFLIKIRCFLKSGK